MSKIFGLDWMPEDTESALCSDLGPAIRENFEFAEVIRPLDELHPWEAWRFVLGLTKEFGRVIDPCCCYASSTMQGAFEVMEANDRWTEAVKASARLYPS